MTLTKEQVEALLRDNARMRSALIRVSHGQVSDGGEPTPMQLLVATQRYAAAELEELEYTYDRA